MGSPCFPSNTIRLRRLQATKLRCRSSEQRRVGRELLSCFSLLLELHSRIVGAGRTARFTYTIPVASPAGVACGISIGARVRYRRDHRAIAVDVDVGRGRPAPGETHRIYAPHLVLRGAERDRPRFALV